MTSPVSVGKSEGLRKASGAPSPGQPPRAIVGSPGRASSQSCAPPLDQLLPGHVTPAAFKAPAPVEPDVPAAPEHAEEAASGKGSAGQASIKAAAPFRVLSMNSDRSQAAQSIAKAAEAGQPPAASKVQQGSVAQAQTSVKAAPKQPAPVRSGTQRPGMASLQPPVRVRSPQKRSAPPVASPLHHACSQPCSHICASPALCAAAAQRSHARAFQHQSSWDGCAAADGPAAPTVSQPGHAGGCRDPWLCASTHALPEPAAHAAGALQAAARAPPACADHVGCAAADHHAAHAAAGAAQLSAGRARSCLSCPSSFCPSRRQCTLPAREASALDHHWMRMSQGVTVCLPAQ